MYDNSHAIAKMVSEQQAESIILLCSRFMEAMMTLENYWFFSTSFSVFVHNNNVDDCVDFSRVGHQSETLMCLMR